MPPLGRHGKQVLSLLQMAYGDLSSAYSEHMRSATLAAVNIILIESCRDFIREKAAVIKALTEQTTLSSESSIVDKIVYG